MIRCDGGDDSETTAGDSFDLDDEVVELDVLEDDVSDDGDEEDNEEGDRFGRVDTSTGIFSRTDVWGEQGGIPVKKLFSMVIASGGGVLCC